MIDLLEQVEITNNAGDKLRDARIKEIETEADLAREQTIVINRGLDGKNQRERDANMNDRCDSWTDIRDMAKKTRIESAQKYSNAKRTLRIMELIYKVENE